MKKLLLTIGAILLLSLNNTSFQISSDVDYPTEDVIVPSEPTY